MIYYVTAVDINNGDEWVMSTHDNAEQAAAAVELYRAKQPAVPHIGYRVDTVPTNTVQPHEKMRLSAEYGRGKMDHEENHYAYRDTDSIRTIAQQELSDTLPLCDVAVSHPVDAGTTDFTLTELFGWYDGNDANEKLKECSECGSAVSNMETHRIWHNKLLP